MKFTLTQIVIEPKQLALALTGLGYLDCEIAFYNDKPDICD